MAAKPVVVTATQQAKLKKIQSLLDANAFEKVIARGVRLAAELPNVPFIPNAIGIAQAQLAHHRRAVAFFKQALKINPRFGPAYVNLSTSLRMIGKTQDAVRSAKDGVALMPNDPAAQCNLAVAFHFDGATEDAIATLTALLASAPAQRGAHDVLCEIYESASMLDALRAAIINAKAALGDDDALINYWDATLLLRQQDHTGVLDALAQFDAADLPPEKMHKYFEIKGKAYDKLAHFDDAYEAFEQSNRLTIRGAAALKNAKHYVEAIRHQTRDLTKSRRVVWDAQERQARQLCFLVGFPRSGTTLLDTMLRGHPSVQVVEEQPMVQRMHDSLDGRVSLKDLTALRDDDIAALRGRYHDELRQHINADEPDALIVDKLPLNLVHAAVIKRVFPDAKFMLSLRHPFDCVLSNFMQGFGSNPAMDNLLDLNQAASFYDAAMSYWDAATQTLSIAAHQVKYEDLVDNKEATMRAVFDYLALGWDARALDHVATAKARTKISTPSRSQVTQPIYKTSHGRWRSYEKHLAPVAPVLAPWVARWGY